MAVKKKGGLKRGLDALFEDNVVPFNLDQEENEILYTVLPEFER